MNLNVHLVIWINLIVQVYSGRIELTVAVINPFFKKELLKWLKVICFKCGRPIIELKNAKKFKKSKLLDEYVKSTRNSSNKSLNCIHCDTTHPIVKKDSKSLLRILIQLNEEEKRLYNHEIENILARITDETVIKLGKKLLSHPNKFMLKTIKVAPISIRPDMKKTKGGRSSSNDLTDFI